MRAPGPSSTLASLRKVSSTSGGSATSWSRATSPTESARPTTHLCLWRCRIPLAVARDQFSMNAQQVPRGTGTGFVWDERGYIVTNFHVVQDASGARVTLADQRSFRAKLVGTFPDRDLAVLKIDAPNSLRWPSVPART